MRKLIVAILLIAFATGAWLTWGEGTSLLHDSIKQYIENGELTTLEVRFYPEQIMKSQRESLIGNSNRSYREPEIKYFPYLLIESKYTQTDKKTREGMILWSLVNGEMVLDTDTWEETSGFADAIKANANRNDFKLMNALAKHQGSCSQEMLQQELHMDPDALAPWVESICKKRLVVQVGHDLQLHFQEPKIFVTPLTRIKTSFVSKNYNYQQCEPKKYSRGQIQQAAQAAFGPTFTIRNIREVYLPVHCIGILNPDGSSSITYWNAISGKRIQKG